MFSENSGPHNISHNIIKARRSECCVHVSKPYSALLLDFNLLIGIIYAISINCESFLNISKDNDHTKRAIFPGFENIKQRWKINDDNSISCQIWCNLGCLKKMRHLLSFLSPPIFMLQFYAFLWAEIWGPSVRSAYINMSER